MSGSLLRRGLVGVVVAALGWSLTAEDANAFHGWRRGGGSSGGSWGSWGSSGGSWGSSGGSWGSSGGWTHYRVRHVHHSTGGSWGSSGGSWGSSGGSWGSSGGSWGGGYHVEMKDAPMEVKKPMDDAKPMDKKGDEPPKTDGKEGKKEEGKKEEGKEASRGASTMLVVSVPADARIIVNGKATTTSGELRRFIARNLTPGMKYSYQIRADLDQNGQVLTETKTLEIAAGETIDVAFDFSAAKVAQATR